MEEEDAEEQWQSNSERLESVEESVKERKNVWTVIGGGGGMTRPPRATPRLARRGKCSGMPHASPLQLFEDADTPRLPPATALTMVRKLKHHEQKLLKKVRATRAPSLPPR
jgi:hypothetical protein